jgi:hypothetical protein
MQRYMSIGTSTIVALMEAHRAVSKQSDATPATFDQTVIASINIHLVDHAPHIPSAAGTDAADESV